MVPDGLGAADNASYGVDLPTDIIAQPRHLAAAGRLISFLAISRCLKVLYPTLVTHPGPLAALSLAFRARDQKSVKDSSPAYFTRSRGYATPPQVKMTWSREGKTTPINWPAGGTPGGVVSPTMSSFTTAQFHCQAGSVVESKVVPSARNQHAELVRGW